MFGLDMTALTWTYLPPTWLITSAYWLSAPTATILPLSGAAVARLEKAATAVAASAAKTASSKVHTGRLPVPLPALVPSARPRMSTLPARAGFRPVQC